jgi:hypothetical protein
VVDEVTDCYRKGYLRVRDKVETTMDKSEPPETIARLIYDLIRKKKPAIRYPAGKAAGTISFMVRHFPQALVEKALLGYYRLPKKRG